ncbi:gp32 [Listeria phage A511]|uniref:Gp32 n=1 Tax=Listeria phage A511 TaxID=2908169 RepID=A8AT56_BPA51|nr:gp32 [Listeria phage A511]YP_010843627.1 hypothetical protein PI27_gp060 [Listeria phage WIL-1]AAY53003.1 gp32 [Listeria phage A511]
MKIYTSKLASLVRSKPTCSHVYIWEGTASKWKAIENTNIYTRDVLLVCKHCRSHKKEKQEALVSQKDKVVFRYSLADFVKVDPHEILEMEEEA